MRFAFFLIRAARMVNQGRTHTMLTTQRCAAAVVLTLAMIGGWCARGAVADDEPAHGEPLALVRQLGSTDFAERETAQQQLRALGVKALPLVSAGRKDNDREIARRCALLFPILRADWLKEFRAELRTGKAGAKDHDHPIWRRFKQIAGDSQASRELLAQILVDDRTAQRLDTADDSPEKTGELYRQEVEHLAANIQKALDTSPLPRVGLSLNPWVPDPTPQVADVAAGLYLGTYPATAREFPTPGEDRAIHGLRPVQESMGLFHNTFQDGIKGQYGLPLKRLFAAWLAQRANPESIFNGLDCARTGMIAEALPVARKVAANDKLIVKCRAAALPILGMYGKPADAPLMAAFLGETSVFTEYQCAGKKTVVQVRDVALGTLLAMHGRNPGDFGFPAFANQEYGPNCYVYFYPHELGFVDNVSREAAHERGTKWLANRISPTRGQ
jgi:hypothetical protein